jgi:hypothetical protein
MTDGDDTRDPTFASSWLMGHFVLDYGLNVGAYTFLLRTVADRGG